MLCFSTVLWDSYVCVLSIPTEVVTYLPPHLIYVPIAQCNSTTNSLHDVCEVVVFFVIQSLCLVQEFGLTMTYSTLSEYIDSVLQSGQKFPNYKVL